MILTEENLSAQRKYLSQCHLVQHKSHMDWPGNESGPPRLNFPKFLKTNAELSQLILYNIKRSIIQSKHSCIKTRAVISNRLTYI
jgi:hypothetical protein